MAKNLAGYKNANLVQEDVSDGSGMNRGIGPIGPNSGDYAPKPSNWSEDERIVENTPFMGFIDPGPIVTANDLDSLIFVQAQADTAPLANYGPSLEAVNLTGKTIPAGEWAWGLNVGGAAEGLIFRAPLLNSTLPIQAVDPTVTYPTAGSVRMIDDYEGILRRVDVGELRFRGTRRVANRLSDMPGLFDSRGANWALSGGARVDNTTFVNYSGSAGDQLSAVGPPDTGIGGLAGERTYAFTADVQLVSAVTGTSASHFHLSMSDGTSQFGTVTVEPADNSYHRYTVIGTPINDVTGGSPGVRIRYPVGASNVEINIKNVLLEEISGASSQNPARNVDSLTDYDLGLSVVGVRDFVTTNGDTYTDDATTSIKDGSAVGGVVTEATGAPISGGTLKYYYAEPTIDNLIPEPLDFEDAAWVKANCT
ncbi:unnamed protein product, partial [marine sediment metagenome]